MSIKIHIFLEVLPSSRKSVSSGILVRKLQDFHMLVTVYIHKLCTYFPDDMLQVNGIGKTKIEEPVNSESVPCLQVRRKGIDFRQEGQTPL